MDHISLVTSGSMGAGFIPEEYLPAGKDEHYLRNSQQERPLGEWRSLRTGELERLVKNGNFAENWDTVLVTEDFDPAQVRNSQFFGLVRIGRIHSAVLEHHDLRIMAGITNSKIISCDIGDDCAIHNVRYLSHYIIGHRVILTNIDEMHTTNYAKFGNGIIKEGEEEEVRIWLDLMNEAGGRQVMPFDEMIAADAYLWAKFREDTGLQRALARMTQASCDARRGYYGTVGDQTVIKNSRIIKDVRIGSCCYIKGANKLKNLTVKSSGEEPSQIGEGVELVNGIIGYGCHIFYGCKAVRFITGSNSHLKYGARLLNSFLGDNSTVSCCEILNNLLFPGHEQHHNNSFLVAACVLGQSNIAAGATIGSNHNSRANDNEIQAGRGFWPGLCTSLKHSSRFASFVLMAKGDYPAELDIPLPFSLVNNNTADDRLEVMPGYWWMYDMYALARNGWKYRKRDVRKRKVQHIECDYLAPDTVAEIEKGCKLLELWAGSEFLTGTEGAGGSREVLGKNMERSKRKTVILKPREGYTAYRDMLLYYGTVNVVDFLESRVGDDPAEALADLYSGHSTEWFNLGGQLVPSEEMRNLAADIACGRLDSWTAVHTRYDELWAAYPLEKQRHAFAVLRRRINPAAPEEELTIGQLSAALQEGLRIQREIAEAVFRSRKKDFDNPFKKATFLNEEEMEAVVGTVDHSEFIRKIREETRHFERRIRALLERLG